MALTTAQLSLIEQRVANDAPSTAVAYLLWFFLGLVSAHRFYLGRAGTAILQILSYFVFVGFIWLLVDGFLIPGMIREKKDQIRQRMTTELLAHAGTNDGPAPAPTLAAPPIAAQPPAASDGGDGVTEGGALGEALPGTAAEPNAR